MADADGLPGQIRRCRDVRLDFFRGLALIVIFIGHMPMNPLFHITPGRFGFSDSAEIFVFCSGIAAAIAFARVFEKHGWVIGSGRVLLRMWQVYWAHIATFLVVLAANLQFDRWSGTGTRFVEGMNLKNFLDSYSGEALLGLLTLGYVPNYFDILPMYVVVLAMVPLVMALASLQNGIRIVAVLVLALWAAAELDLLELSASPWSERKWFFNPFSWQLIFFLGFALGRGWLPVPPRDRKLLAAAAAVLVVSLPFAWAPLAQAIGYSPSFLHMLDQLIDKTHLGALRVAHFAALAYVGYMLAGESGRNLRGAAAEVLQTLGRQTLAVFVTGLLMSVFGGYLLQLAGVTPWAVVAVNVGGIAILYAVALLVEWVKSSPWQKPATRDETTGALAVPVAEPVRTTSS